jgi:hypothetical protein
LDGGVGSSGGACAGSGRRNLVSGFNFLSFGGLTLIGVNAGFSSGRRGGPESLFRFLLSGLSIDMEESSWFIDIGRGRISRLSGCACWNFPLGVRKPGCGLEYCGNRVLPWLSTGFPELTNPRNAYAEFSDSISQTDTGKETSAIRDTEGH